MGPYQVCMYKLIMTNFITNFNLTSSSAMTKLMIVGGYNDPGFNYVAPSANDVEVIDLVSNITCFKPNDCPLDAFSVGTFMQGQARVCESSNSNRCYSYQGSNSDILFDPNAWNNWDISFSTDKQRRSAGSVLLNDNEWWILGGYSVSNFCADCIRMKCLTKQ